MVLKLVQNEWMKLFNRIGTYVMLSLLGLGIILTGVIVYFNQTEKTDLPSREVWEKELQEENKSLATQEEEAFNRYILSYVRNQQAINSYRTEKGISPYEETNVWKYMETNAALVQLIGVFVIIVGSSIVAHEFNKGTIKLLLVRSASRTQILAAKFITTLLFGLLLLAVLFVLSFIIGSVLFGFGGTSAHITAVDGVAIERSRILFIGLSYLSSSVSMVMLSAMAFMISTIFRNETFAIAISVTLLFIGSMVTNILGVFTDWVKYSLFANTNLEVYFAGGPMIEGMTIQFSIVVLLVYFIVFLLLAFFFFRKRDVNI
jgi:ABC-2 type transport system permease protein